MAQFIILLGGVDIDSHRIENGADKSPDSIINKYAKWAGGLARSGKLIQAEKLKDGVGFRVTKKNNEILDGPFTETKETISSFFLIEAANYQEAIQIARECPAVVDQDGYTEVRELTTCPGTSL